MARVNKTEKG